MIQHKNYFGHIVDAQVNKTTKKLIFDVYLFDAAVAEGMERINIQERIYTGDRSGVYYDLTIDHQTLQRVKEFFEQPFALSGVKMTFSTQDGDDWRQDMVRNHSLFAKKLFINAKNFKQPLHQTDDEEELAVA